MGEIAIGFGGYDEVRIKDVDAKVTGYVDPVNQYDTKNDTSEIKNVHKRWENLAWDIQAGRGRNTPGWLL